jgi:hypothetical protein
VRYHVLDQLTETALSQLDTVPLGRLCSAITNGLNVPGRAYCDEATDAGALYVSVGAISQFTLNETVSVGLRIDGEGKIEGTKFGNCSGGRHQRMST